MTNMIDQVIQAGDDALQREIQVHRLEEYIKLSERIEDSLTKENFANELFEMGEKLKSGGCSEIAWRICFERCCKVSTDFELKLKSHTAVACCIVETLESHGVEYGLIGLNHIKQILQDVVDTKFSEHNYWHVLNAVLLAMDIGRPLLCAGSGALVVDTLVFGLMVMEHMLPLCTIAYTERKTRLYYLIFECYEQVGDFGACEKVSKRLENVIVELGKDERQQLPVPEKTLDILDQSIRDAKMMQLKCQIYSMGEGDSTLLSEIVQQNILNNSSVFHTNDQKVEALFYVAWILGDRTLAATAVAVSPFFIHNTVTVELLGPIIAEAVLECDTSECTQDLVYKMSMYLFRHRQWAAFCPLIASLPCTSPKVSLLQALYLLECEAPNPVSIGLEEDSDKIGGPVAHVENRVFQVNPMRFLSQTLISCIGEVDSDLLTDAALLLWSPFCKAMLDTIGLTQGSINHGLMEIALEALSSIHAVLNECECSDIPLRASISLRLAQLALLDNDLVFAIQVIRKSLQTINTYASESELIGSMHADTLSFLYLLELKQGGSDIEKRLLTECKANSFAKSILLATISTMKPLDDYQGRLETFKKVAKLLESRQVSDKSDIVLVLRRSVSRFEFQIVHPSDDPISYFKVTAKGNHLPGTNVPVFSNSKIVVSGLSPNVGYTFNIIAYDQQHKPVSTDVFSIGAFIPMPTRYCGMIVSRLMFQSISHFRMLKNLHPSIMEIVKQCFELCNASVKKLLDSFMCEKSIGPLWARNPFEDINLNQSQLLNLPQSFLQHLICLILIQDEMRTCAKDKNQYQKEIQALYQLRSLVLGIHIAAAISDHYLTCTFAIKCYNVYLHHVSHPMFFQPLVSILACLKMVPRKLWSDGIKRVYLCTTYDILRMTVKETSLGIAVLPEAPQEELQLSEFKFLPDDLLSDEYSLSRYFAIEYLPRAEGTFNNLELFGPYEENRIFLKVAAARVSENVDDAINVLSLLEEDFIHKMPDFLRIMCVILSMCNKFKSINLMEWCDKFQSLILDSDTQSTSHPTPFVKLILEEELLENSDPYNAVVCKTYPLSKEQDLFVEAEILQHELDNSVQDEENVVNADDTLEDVEDPRMKQLEMLERRKTLIAEQNRTPSEIEKYQLSCLAQLELECLNQSYSSLMMLNYSNIKVKFNNGVFNEGPLTDLQWQSISPVPPILSQIEEDSHETVLDDVRKDIPNILHRGSRAAVRAMWAHSWSQLEQAGKMIWNSLIVGNVSPLEFEENVISENSLKPDAKSHKEEADEMKTYENEPEEISAFDWKPIYRTSSALLPMLQEQGYECDRKWCSHFILFCLQILFHLGRWSELFSLGKQFLSFEPACVRAHTITSFALRQIIESAIADKQVTEECLQDIVDSWSNKAKKKRRHSNRNNSKYEEISLAEKEYLEKKANAQQQLDIETQRVADLEGQAIERCANTKSKFQIALDTARVIRKQLQIEHFLGGQNLSTLMKPHKLSPSARSGRGSIASRVSSKISHKSSFMTTKLEEKEEEFENRLDGENVRSLIKSYQDAISLSRDELPIFLQGNFELGVIYAAVGGSKSTRNALRCWNDSIDALFQTTDAISNWRVLLSELVEKNESFGVQDTRLLISSELSGQSILAGFGKLEAILAGITASKIGECNPKNEQHRIMEHYRLSGYLLSAIACTGGRHPTRYCDFATFKMHQLELPDDILLRELVAALERTSNALCDSGVKRDLLVTLPLWCTLEFIFENTCVSIPELARVRLMKSICLAKLGLMTESLMPLLAGFTPEGHDDEEILHDLEFNSDEKPWSDTNMATLQSLLKVTSPSGLVTFAKAQFVYSAVCFWGGVKDSEADSIVKTLLDILTNEDTARCLILRCLLMADRGSGNQAIALLGESDPRDVAEWLEVKHCMIRILFDGERFHECIQECEESLRQCAAIQELSFQNIFKSFLAISMSKVGRVFEFVDCEETFEILEAKANIVQDPEPWLRLAIQKSTEDLTALGFFGELSHRTRRSIFLCPLLKSVQLQFTLGKLLFNKGNYREASQLFHDAYTIALSSPFKSEWLECVLVYERSKSIRLDEGRTQSDILARCFLTALEVGFDLQLLRNIALELHLSGAGTHWLATACSIGQCSKEFDAKLFKCSVLPESDRKAFFNSEKICSKLAGESTLELCLQFYSANCSAVLWFEKANVLASLHAYLKTVIPDFASNCCFQFKHSQHFNSDDSLLKLKEDFVCDKLLVQYYTTGICTLMIAAFKDVSISKPVNKQEIIRLHKGFNKGIFQQLILEIMDTDTLSVNAEYADTFTNAFNMLYGCQECLDCEAVASWWTQYLTNKK